MGSVSIDEITHDGRVMAIIQFLYVQYHIWDEQGTHSADSTEKFIGPICLS